LLTTGVGFTVIVKVLTDPEHDVPFVKVGVTTIVATTGAVPALIAVKDGISPEPLAASPMPGVLFVHA
jgi:hypothetical protein